MVSVTPLPLAVATWADGLTSFCIVIVPLLLEPSVVICLIVEPAGIPVPDID